MPQEVIDQVNKLSANEEQPELLTFYDWKGNFVGDADFESGKNIKIINDRVTEAISKFETHAEAKNYNAADA